MELTQTRVLQPDFCYTEPEKGIVVENMDFK